MAAEHINPKAREIFDRLLVDYREAYTEETLPWWRGLSAGEKQKYPEPINPDEVQDAWDNAASNYCESPIEQMLLAALIFATNGYDSSRLEIWFTDVPFAPPDNKLLVAPQFKFGDYRLDLAIFGKDFSGNEIRLAIECDGHNFHKSKDQVKRDRKRDRFLQLNGWHVMRFTGSEIWEDAEACVGEIEALMTDLLEIDMERNLNISQTWRTSRLRKAGYVSPFELIGRA